MNLNRRFKNFLMKKILLFTCLTLLFFSCKKVATDPGSLPNAYSDQKLGASANDMLGGGKYTTLNVQVQYMPGYALDPAVVTAVTDYLSGICNKPGGVTITQSQIAANGDTLTVDKVAVLEQQNRTAYTGGATISLYVMVTDGYDTAKTVLGFAYRNTSICLFGKSVFDHSGGFGEVSRVSLETSVLEHELGHIMGLVNLGTPMVVFHQDTLHNNHCTNARCLMHWAIETQSAYNITHPNSVPGLDSNCRNDLRANGGK
jgi:hypothetical protein